QDEEEEFEEFEQEVNMPDLMVKTSAYEVSPVNQKFKNALDVRAHQYQDKERVVGKGNNLLGTRYVPGRGGPSFPGCLGGRGGRFVDNHRSWSDVVTGTHREEEGQAFEVLEKSLLSLEFLTNRSLLGQLHLVEVTNPDHHEIIEIKEDIVDETSWEDCLVGYFLDAHLPFGLVRATTKTLWSQHGLVDL
ncbi:hypothetical protein U1Q18_010601, partial [Sarracenia purpurea var. burkii]